MNLNEVAKAVTQEMRMRARFSICLYGDPKTGKSRLAATIAKVPWIKKVHYFDIENGRETLVTMVREGIITAEEAEKVIIYAIPDTKQLPMAMETMMKCLTVHKDLVICDMHGKVSCVPCADKDAKGNWTKLNGTPFNISKVANDEVVVIDTGSQLGDSILNHYMNQHGNPDKPGWDEYGPQGLDLTNIGQVIQSGICNFIMLTHTLTVDIKENDKESEMIYPLVGTKNMSKKFGKYFGHVIYLHKKLNMHKAGSSSTYQPNVVTGSRAGWKIEQEGVLDFSLLFARIGITKETQRG